MPHRQPRSAELTEQDIKALACDFLDSEFAGRFYASWSIDRCIDGYLRHCDMNHIANDGDAYNAVLQQILAVMHTAVKTESEDTQRNRS